MVKHGCTIALVALAAAGTLASPALASHGDGGGGHGGGSETPLPPPPIPPATFDGIGPGPVYIHDSFGHAQRTRLRRDGAVVDVVDKPEVDGIRAEFPNNEAETWSGTSVSGAPSWKFTTVSSADPFEPSSPLQTGDFGFMNGNLFLVGAEPGGPDTRPVALVPFPAPAGSAATVSADTVPFVGRTAIGFTSSGATNRNFESDGQAWLELDSPGIRFSGVNTGTWTFHTDGLSGTTLSGSYVLGDPDNRMAVSYDPVAHVAAATVDGSVVASVPYTARTISYAGAEGSLNANVDNFTVRTGSVTGAP